MFLTVENGLILGPVCWILGKLFNAIYLFVGMIGENVFNIHYVNLSACVILFTFIIRGCLLPINFKQQKSSKIMSFVQPEIEKVTKKYKGKNDQESLMKKNEETQKIQKKYGISMTAGCLPSLLQLPVFYGLYRVIQNIPAYVTDMTTKYGDIVSIIKEVDPSKMNSAKLAELGISSTKYVDIINAIATDNDGKVTTAIAAAKKMMDASEGGTLNDNLIVDVLDKISSSDWQQIIDVFNLSSNTTVVNNVNEFSQMNKFLFGLNISDAPGWALSAGLLIPICAALFQLLQSVISMRTTQSSSSNDELGANKMMKGMMYYMPVISFMFCVNLPIAIGLYWIIGSIIAIISQLIINAYYSKCDKEELLRQCMEKAAKKQAKHPEKKSFMDKLLEAQNGNVSTDENQSQNINKMANTRFKNYTNPTTSDNSSGNTASDKKFKEGSIASKANIMLQYQNKK